ncbi:MAG: hypothetical protein AABX13_03275 [Nanoarchaeota archaeon]
MRKTTRAKPAKDVRVVLDVQEKTASKLPVFSLWARHFRFTKVEGMKKYLHQLYSANYTLERKEQKGEWETYFFRAQGQPAERPRRLAKAEYVQVRLRPRVVGIR